MVFENRMKGGLKLDKKNQLIQQLEELHRDQRRWSRLVYGEELDIDYLRTLSVEDLEKLVEHFEQFTKN